VLDTACARLALSQSATPPPIEDASRQLDDLEVQQRVLERETAVGANHSERLTEIAKQKVEVESRLSALQARRDKEFKLVSRIREVRAQLESTPAPQASTSDGSTAAQPALDIPRCARNLVGSSRSFLPFRGKRR